MLDVKFQERDISPGILRRRRRPAAKEYERLSKCFVQLKVVCTNHYDCRTTERASIRPAPSHRTEGHMPTGASCRSARVGRWPGGRNRPPRSEGADLFSRTASSLDYRQPDRSVPLRAFRPAHGTQVVDDPTSCAGYCRTSMQKVAEDPNHSSW